jgi:hypothetical protein
MKLCMIAWLMLLGSICCAANWETCELCGCDYAKGEYEIHLSGSAHNPPLDAYPKFFYSYPPEKLIDELKTDKVERERFLKWRRLYEEWYLFGRDL